MRSRHAKVIAEARRRMRAGEADAFSSPAPLAGLAVPREITLAPGEYVWLAFITGMGVLTSRRLVTSWRPLAGGTPVVVQASLGTLLPPVLRGTSVITCLAAADGSSRRGWKALTWPAATVTPPAFTGLANAPQVAGLIGDAQMAIRAPVNRQPLR